MKYTDSSLTQEYDSDEDEVFNAESDEESSESEAAESDNEITLNNNKRQSSRKPLASKSSRNTPARKSTKVTLADIGNTFIQTDCYRDEIGFWCF